MLTDKIGPYILEQEWSHTVAHCFIYMHVLLSKPSSQLTLTLTFLTVQDEEDMHSPFLFCGTNPSEWLVLDYRRARCPHTKPVSWLRTNPADYHWENFARLQATEDPVGACLLARKNNFEGCGRKETAFRTSADNKEQELDHQGIVEVSVCLHISCLLALLCNFKGRYFDSVLWLWVITQIPNEVRTL